MIIQSKKFGRSIWFIVLGALACATLSGAQVIVGGDSADGFIKVRDSSHPDALSFEVDAAGNVVKIGTSGANAVDMDLVIARGTSPAVRVNANSSALYLGDPGSTDDGDLIAYDASGVETFRLNGNSAGLTLGGLNEPGAIAVVDGAISESIRLEGSTGDLTQVATGEGLVKAWCQIGLDGTYIDGFRCTNDATYPLDAGNGVIQLDFTALSTDITSRPVVVSCTSNQNVITTATCTQTRAFIASGNNSGLTVYLYDKDGAGVDSHFTVMIF